MTERELEAAYAAYRGALYEERGLTVEEVRAIRAALDAVETLRQDGLEEYVQSVLQSEPC